ncbi:MAG: hypothetical protein AB7P20_12860 [Rhizobiaceae bacterium]
MAAALAASVAAAPALFARDGDRGMMGHDGMMGNGGMMGMMDSMMRMMEHCNQMMGNNSGQPNDQWQKDSPKSKEKL